MVAGGARKGVLLRSGGGVPRSARVSGNMASIVIFRLDDGVRSTAVH